MSQKILNVIGTLALALGVPVVVIFYAKSEPNSSLGTFAVKMSYDPNSENLGDLAELLKKNEGGKVGAGMDRFLIERLDQVEPGSDEFRNIIGFYAKQSSIGQAGEQLFINGKKRLKNVVKLGLKQTDPSSARCYLHLAEALNKEKSPEKMGGDTPTLEIIRTRLKGLLE